MNNRSSTLIHSYRLKSRNNNGKKFYKYFQRDDFTWRKRSWNVIRGFNRSFTRETDSHGLSAHKKLFYHCISIFFPYIFDIHSNIFFHIFIHSSKVHSSIGIYFSSYLERNKVSYQLRILISIRNETFRQCSCMYQIIISYYQTCIRIYIFYIDYFRIIVIGNIERNIFCSTNRCPILFSFYGYKNTDFWMAANEWPLIVSNRL